MSRKFNVGQLPTGSYSISGSFSGSFVGDGSGIQGITATAEPAGPIDSVQFNDGLNVSGSSKFTFNKVTGVATVTSSFAITASHALNGGGGSAFPFIGDAVITGSLTVSGSDSIVNLQEVQFDTNHSASGHSTGRIYWDDNNKTFTGDMQGSDVRLQIGQEEHVYVFNNSGVTINNGDAVRISGANGANVTITKAVSSIKSFKDETEQDQILGVATEQIADNQRGYVTTFGAVRDLDTSAFSEGDILYLSATTSGSYSNIRPAAPNFEARVGVVQIANATEGVVLVRPQEPTFLTDISQVTSSGVVTDEKAYLVYDDNTDLISFTNEFSGSFSGSFQGNGSALTNLTLPNGTVSGSAQISELGFVTSSATSSFVLNSQTSSMSVLSSSYAVTASFALNGGGGSTDTGSLLTTASVSLNTITFTKGDGSTFPITVDTGSGGGGGGVPSGTVSSSAQITELGFVTSSATASFVLNSQTSSMSVATASYIEYSNVANKPALVSGSAQISYAGITDIPAGILSSSAQIATDISGAFSSDSASFSTRVTANETSITSLNSVTGSYAITGSNTFTGNQTINGNLTVYGTGSFDVIHTIYETSSIIYASGSTKFGDTMDDTHIRTGSMFITGSVTALDYTGIFNGALSSSAQIATEISGAFATDSASFSTRITTNETNISTLTAATSSYILASQTSSMSVLSSSFAISASYAPSADAFPFVGDAVITGSLIVSGSGINVTSGSITGDGSGLTNISSPSLNDISLGNSTVVGDGASSATTYGTVFGKSATSTGGQNVGIGSFSNVKTFGVSIGHSVVGGNNTVAIGYNAGHTSGENNVLVGYQPGTNTSGDYNISLGYLAGYDQTTGTGNITIGSGSRGIAGESNQLRIGHGIHGATISASLETGDVIFASTASATYFVGDGSQLTNVASPFTAAGISGSFTAPSASFSTRVTANEVVTAKTLISSSAQIASDISGSFTAPSASFSTRITTNETNISTLTAATASYLTSLPAGVLSGSAQIATEISGAFGAPSASFSTRVTTLEGAGTPTPTFIASGSTSASAAPNTGVVVEHSGSTAFSVIGDVGTLFSVDDSLTGTLFSVNDISGFPVLQAEADGDVYLGKSPQSLYTTAVISSNTANITQSIYGISTSSYAGAFIEYTAFSGSHDARAGSLMAIWSGSAVNFTETTTTDFGDTSNLLMQVAISQSQAQVQSYSTTAGYKIKTIIKAI